MTDSKVTYKSKNLVVTSGGRAAAETAAQASGKPPGETEAMLDYADFIMDEARRRGLTPEQCYTASLNVLARFLFMMTPEGQAQAISVTTEALCAISGGGSDEGSRVQ